MKRSSTGLIVLGAGAAGAGLLAWFAVRKSKQTETAVDNAIKGIDGPPVIDSSGQVVSGGGKIQLRLTGYWPFQSGLSTTERKMEGGTKDRKGNPLHTVEQWLSDPKTHPFVSLSGDDAIWPYGQRVDIPWGDRTILGRVVDTGSHFRGPGKIVRAVGYEPIDVCVENSKTVLPNRLVSATIIPKDNFASGKAVATGKFTGQTVAGADVIGYSEAIDVYTSDDHEALARALESELTSRPRPELEAAAWAIRNRAEDLDVSIYDLLAPRNKYGSPHETRGYASTRREPSELARTVAREVLGGGDDPTHGAVDFWVPSHQQKMNQLGDVYWAALANNDSEKAAKYERYSSYGSIDDVRVAHQRYGLSAVQSIGLVELLRRD